MLQLHVEIPDQGATSNDFSVTIVERQATVAHILAVYTLGSRGDADDLSVLDISA